MSCNERFAEYKAFIEKYLSDYIQSFSDEPQQILYEAMNYSLKAGGKRLRPILVFEFCRLCGQNWKTAAPFAAALEMIHTYSLIHDDLPCMDNDDLRRGRPTNHKVYGEGIAVLAGDALLTDAFGLAASMPVPDLGLAIQVLSQNAGSQGMVGGQILDILSEERVCSEKEVLDIQNRKTGGLINAACVLGVIAGAGSQEQIKAAAGFAGCLGLAFQIRDDILDVIGDAKELGKSVGTDLQKNTFVRLYGIPKCEELVEKYTSAAIDYLKIFEGADDLIALANSMTSRRV